MCSRLATANHNKSTKPNYSICYIVVRIQMNFLSSTLLCYRVRTGFENPLLKYIVQNVLKLFLLLLLFCSQGRMKVKIV